MSYDYNELVSKISSSRRLAAESEGDEKTLHLQEAVDAFSNLSTQCPMTPLLWMQYSSDTAALLRTLTSDLASAQETHLQLLELALSEFPGSAILHFRYLQVLSQDHEDKEKLKKAIQNAIQNVGQGSHRNEGELIAAIYRLDAEQQVDANFEAASASYCQRACVPMRDVNDSLSGEFQEFCIRHGRKAKPEELQLLENGRRYEAKIFRSLVTSEDEVDMTMYAGGILPRHQINLEEIEWDSALRSDEKTFWMGLGGVDVANSFNQYARACFRYRKPLDYDDEDGNIEAKVRGLALSVYERGIAECPTAESVWLAYTQHLLHEVERDDNMISRLKSVVDRSVRNCPYSLQLFQHKIRLLFLMASRGKSVMDPDEVMKIVKEALDAKFIVSKEACLELHMTAIHVLRRQVLSLLASSSGNSNGKDLSYDGVEPAKSLTYTEIDQDTAQDLEDLLDDIREMYDAVDQFLRKQFSSWSEGRSSLWLDRAFAESYLIGPLIESFRKERTNGPITQLSELIRCYDKATNIHKPVHPDAFISYIKGFLATFPTSSPYGVLSKIRQVRWLYQKAMRSVGQPKQTALPQNPLIDILYETSLRCLCHDYLVFERCFGSETSLADASKVITKKLAKLYPSRQQDVAALRAPPAKSEIDITMTDATTKDGTGEEEGNKKRGREDDEGAQPTKKLKSENDPGQNPSDTALEGSTENDETTKKTDLRVLKPKGHKAKIGNLEYPVHPFTVRVSNLASNTEDMDLVDKFRKSCGAIVHARIMREKHHHGKGKSKGWGLIQFEEKEFVEKALELSEVFGINEKLVKIERSHLPAAELVPSGMHRVNPKGKGKKSKQNNSRSESRGTDRIARSDKESKSTTATKADSKQDVADKGEGSEMGLLSFRPRGVAKGRKTKVALSTPKK
jgi:hypothetical protein